MPPSSTAYDNQDLLTSVKRALSEHRLLAPGDRVLVGVSGGPDSMVLLFVLNQLAVELGISLGVAHLNHLLRGAQADRDARTVEKAAIDLGLPHHITSAHVTKVKRGLGLSPEEAARRVRYAFFKKTMIDAGYNKLALGHHLNDNAEQMLMALLRGSGPKGLSGIMPMRQNRIIRPLIQVSRPQIEAFARQNKITFVTDASNRDLRFVRNRVRHRLLPLLTAEYNPRIERQLSQLAEVMRTEDEWIEGLVDASYAGALTHHAKGRLSFRINALQGMHPALVRRCLRRALLELTGTLRQIGFVHIQSIQALLEQGKDGKSVHLPRGIRASRSRNGLDLMLIGDHPRQPANHPNMAPTVIQGPFPCTVKVESLGIGLRFEIRQPDSLPRWGDTGSRQAFFDLNRLSPPLVLRGKLPGDRFVPLGASGSQKIKKFFIDHGIRREERASIPILADQQRIIWLVGWRIDERAKVTPTTSKVLCVDFFLLDTH